MSGRDAPDQPGVTVGVAARGAGLTVRTLHHWDRIGLVRPSARSDAGYRLYDEADRARIARVVTYQRAGLTLDEIARLLSHEPQRLGAAIAEQREHVARRIEQLRALDADLDQIAQAHQRGILLDDAEQRATFGPEWDPDGTRQAQQRWGDSLQWAEFAEHSAGRSRADWARVTASARELEAGLADAVARDVPPNSPEARALVERHREVFAQFFPLTRSMQVCLGRLFAHDPAFAAYYDRIQPGLATWLNAAIDGAARHHGIDPDRATWE